MTSPDNIIEKILDKIEEMKRTNNLRDMPRDICIALGKREIDCLYYLRYREFTDRIKIGLFRDLKIIEVNEDNYLELFRKL